MPESCEQAEIVAQSWAWLAKRTEHTALMCADAGVHPYDPQRALLPVPMKWSIEMTDLPTVPPTLRTAPPPPPPLPQGRRDDADLRELRRVALDLAVQSIEATSAIGGWVDETRTAVLDTADAYLAWLTGEDGDDAAKREQDRIELRDRRSEDLALRGLLSPNGGPRQVPMELGHSLVPAVEWLLQRNPQLADALGHAVIRYPGSDDAT